MLKIVGLFKCAFCTMYFALFHEYKNPLKRAEDIITKRTMKAFLLVTAIGLCWAQYDPNTKPGRTSIVHLFEWCWADIALECERYLAPNGFGGVQISPPNENIIITNPWRPWWERYQPISYNLCTRSGYDDEFKDMVTRCNNVGVHIYVDAVINHMCGSGVGSGNSSTCGSYFNAVTRDFPAVPYSAWDFNDGKCKTGSGDIENYQDVAQVRDCRLVSLLDLALEKDYVRSKVAEYMNSLIDIGVAGFRIDASKHMWPGDMTAILDKLKNLTAPWFSNGSRPFIYQEVIDLSDEPVKSSEYFGNGRVTEFKYGAKLGTVIRKWNGEKMSYLKNWGEGWGFMPSDRALVFVDNHDTQRGHGAGGASVLTFWDSRLYKMALGFMLAHPYGFTRVMSSYRWPRYFQNGKDINDWVGPPSYEDGSTKPVTINPDSTCGNDWICEHRWRQIKNMVIFRNVVDGQPFSNWWDNGSNQVAFGRGNRGFIIFNNDDWYLKITLQTGLLNGTYCDVISGQKEGDHCTGIQVEVAGDGTANFHISNQAEDPFIAIHVEATL
ncbi:pancreatic alpha-amylase-like [Carettochelys insculpta]|uniref:pancreatic alpha-amylase-like n=1 Tax=Carettochelys insculpta TaxID=44489 RepID=UPI003EBA5169